ncbi:MAG TPA: hypothetical protein VIL32_07880, partial [Steroidobacteraceae bacterium]
MFDMDGTLVLGDKGNRGLKPLPGALELIRYLNEKNVPYVILTNGTVRADEEYLAELRHLGFPLPDGVAFTPSSVAAAYFVRRRYQRILVLGGEGVWKPLAREGLQIVTPSEKSADGADAVYVGWYREFTLADLDVAYHAVEKGARLYAASMVPFFASAHGKAIG